MDDNQLPRSQRTIRKFRVDVVSECRALASMAYTGQGDGALYRWC